MVQDLIDSRIKTGVHTSVLDFRRKMTDHQTWFNHKVFGAFKDDQLVSFSLVRPINMWCWTFIFMMTRRVAGAPIGPTGHNAFTQHMLDFAVRSMEADGYYIVFSARPTKGRWIRTEENPDREVKNEYETTIIETVQADTPPKSAIGKILMTRMHDEDMDVVMKRRIGGSKVYGANQ